MYNMCVCTTFGPINFPHSNLLLWLMPWRPKVRGGIQHRGPPKVIKKKSSNVTTIFTTKVEWENFMLIKMYKHILSLRFAYIYKILYTRNSTNVHKSLHTIYIINSIDGRSTIFEYNYKIVCRWRKHMKSKQASSEIESFILCVMPKIYFCELVPFRWKSTNCKQWKKKMKKLHLKN